MTTIIERGAGAGADYLDQRTGIGAAVKTFARKVFPDHWSFLLGEIALSGEIRPVAHMGLRLKEAAKLGFTSAWVPKGVKPVDGLSTVEFANLRQMGEQILGR